MKNNNYKICILSILFLVLSVSLFATNILPREEIQINKLPQKFIKLESIDNLFENIPEFSDNITSVRSFSIMDDRILGLEGIIQDDDIVKKSGEPIVADLSHSFNSFKLETYKNYGYSVLVETELVYIDIERELVGRYESDKCSKIYISTALLTLGLFKVVNGDNTYFLDINSKTKYILP